MQKTINPGKKELFFFLLLLWFLVNLVQAIFTEINPDEAYYFLYGKYLSWGYFDHPPMVALMVRISSLFFKGNLGVRFMTLLLQIATLVVIWLQLDKVATRGKKSVLFFFIISASITLFAVYGFITTPDAPLLFFTSLYLLSYKSFLKEDNWISTFGITIALAGLIYSKYQGVLVIIFVILSNIRLLANYKLWVAFLLALTICLPHFYWQYSNSFPSFKYHLISRSDPFSFGSVLKYIPDQLAAFNPFTLVAVFYVMYKYKPVHKFEKAQYFIILGFLLFFWMATIRGNAQPQWTIAASIPMIILINNRIASDSWLRNYVRVIVAASLFLVLIGRVLLATSLVPANTDLSKKEYKYRAIEMIAKERPVVFTGSFQNPSLYSFFTGKPATVISSLNTRQTQFDIWNLEQEWDNKPVFVNGFFEGKSRVFIMGKNQVEGFFSQSLQTTKSLKIEFQLNKNSFKNGDSVSAGFTIENPTQRDINFNDPDFPVKVQAIIAGREIYLDRDGFITGKITVLKSKEKIQNEMIFILPYLPKGDYKLALGCSSIFGPTLNSDFEKITLY